MKDKLIVPLVALSLLFGAGINIKIDAAVNAKGEGAGAAIDWKKHTVTSYGTAGISIDYSGMPVTGYKESRTSINDARMNAYAAAKDIAAERLVAALKDLPVTQDATLGKLLTESSQTRQGLSYAIENSKQEFYPTGFDSSGCKIKLSFGDILAALPFSFPEEDFPSRMDTPIPTRYTGLIVDGRGLNIKPMMFPVIYNKHGLEIVSRLNINGAAALKHGMVCFVKNETEAKSIKRLGEHPLYAAAIEDNRGCPVLSERDVRRIFSAPDNLQALRECRIVFITD